MKLIITAGGTTERIDDVRSITNTSTGRLGHAIGRAFLDQKDDEIETLYYLHGLRAAAPEGKQVKAVPVASAEDLRRELEHLLTTEKIDAVIHSMAVSDYTVKELTTMDMLKEGKTLDASKKVSSDVEELVIVMKKTPKVISGIKKASPGTVLVGFKLLSHVPHEELIDVGYRLLQKNQCSFVLANDLSEISPEAHRGYLIHADKTYDIMETNEEIAAMVVKRVWEKAGKK